ncbi:hypothetical protein [Hymenobacter crusticola]|nr:hypothetical protein [Hymenobacter crusticola]
MTVLLFHHLRWLLLGFAALLFGPATAQEPDPAQGHQVGYQQV